jgi:predicted DNA-binding WGR domain protein
MSASSAPHCGGLSTPLGIATALPASLPHLWTPVRFSALRRLFPVARFSFLIHSPVDGSGVVGSAVVLNEISVELEARDASINCQRSWCVDAGPDLFGTWTAEVRFGRIGGSGRTMRHHFPSEELARSFVRARLCRRQSLVHRLRVRYCVIQASPAALALIEVAGLMPEKHEGAQTVDRRARGTGLVDRGVALPELASSGP